MNELREATSLANADLASFGPHETLYGRPKKDLVYYVFDAKSDSKLSAVTLDSKIKGIVFATDGYPVIKATLIETEAYLRELLIADPMRIEKHLSTKGVAPGAVSFDDRAYLRIEL